LRELKPQRKQLIMCPMGFFVTVPNTKFHDSLYLINYCHYEDSKSIQDIW
jgi:hypothetical protein